RSAAAGAPYRMAGKTGTAQVVAIAQGARYDSAALRERHRDHALFVGFAPVDDPQIAVAAMVENGESGGRVAAPVGRMLVDAWLVPEPGAEPESIEEEGTPCSPCPESPPPARDCVGSHYGCAFMSTPGCCC